MINRLINMNPIITNNSYTPNKSMKASITDYAISFLNGLSDTQKNRFKKMLENNIQCGMSVAETYEIDYDDFINEVKKLLKVGE